MTIPQAFQIALQHHQSGRLAEAEALYRQILAAKPAHADALHLLGVIAHQVGRSEAAVELIRQAIVLDRNNRFAHYNLGETLRALGRLDEAIASYQRAIELRPDYAEAHGNLGMALQSKGRLGEAIAAYRRALELKPDWAEALTNLSAALCNNHQFDEAAAVSSHALQIKPDSAEMWHNLGAALQAQGRLDEAGAAYRSALQIRPDYTASANNLGAVLRNQDHLDDSVAVYRRALESNPNLPELHNNLGNVLREQGQITDAIAEYGRALELSPESPGMHSNLVYTLHFDPGITAGAINQERRRWNQRFGEPLKSSLLPHANDRNPDRPLRIGYVSPDFRDHVVGRNLLPLIQSHDRRNFEIVCYASVAQPDGLTEEFRRLAQQWRVTAGMPDEALAGVIRGDKVDILVDLTQHMENNRLPLLARQPAPVQVSFAGYPESSGLEAIEYRISDRYLEAGSADEGPGRKEQIFLIDSFWCYSSLGTNAEVNTLPALENGRITFGCLNNFCKINERVLNLWARVLGRVTGSRFVMLSRVGSQRKRVLEIFEREGVEAHRVEFVEPRPRSAYLELYHGLDVVLDTFPYNGHTTNLDALWMGVPVVSLVGDMPVSRAGLSQLSNLGLPELAAHSEDDFVRTAVELALNLPRLALLRSTMRDRMEDSVLMNPGRFTRQVEQAYREMWRAWVHKQSPM